MITGEQIKAARQRAGLTQGELAQRVGVSLRTVGNWERGESNPRSHETVLRDALRDHLEGAEPAPLQGISDVELLAEIARRFARGQDTKAGGEHDQRSAPRYRAGSAGSNVTALNPPEPGEHIDVSGMAARPGTAAHAERDDAGEESQADPEDNE